MLGYDTRRMRWRTYSAGCSVGGLFLERLDWVGTCTIRYCGGTLLSSAPARFFALEKGHNFGSYELGPGEWLDLELDNQSPVEQRFSGLLLGSRLDLLSFAFVESGGETHVQNQGSEGSGST